MFPILHEGNSNYICLFIVLLFLKKKTLFETLEKMVLPVWKNE